MSKVVTIKVDEEFWEQWKQWCADRGTNASAALKFLASKAMHGGIDWEQLQESQKDIPPDILSELDAMKQQIAEMQQQIATGNSPGAPMPHHPESYGNPANFVGSNPDRQSLRDKLQPA